MINKKDAPEGFKAVAELAVGGGCAGCALKGIGPCGDTACTRGQRLDGHDVIFVKRGAGRHKALKEAAKALITAYHSTGDLYSLQPLLDGLSTQLEALKKA